MSEAYETKMWDVFCENNELRLDNDFLQAENAKLRELVQDMAAEMRGLGVDFKRVGWCDYADQMRELGIEVDE